MTDPRPPMSGAISGHKARDQWICAILNCHNVLTPLELRLAVRLGIFFNCTTGQCDPGYAKLAKELCISPRSARRCIAALVAHGFVGRDEGAGGRHDQKQNFSLFMPSARGTACVSPVGRTASVSPVEAKTLDQHGGLKQVGTGDENRGQRGTTRRPTKEPDEPDEPDEPEGRGSPARTSRVDRESVASNSTNTSDDAPPIQRAPGGALIEPVAAQKQQPPERNKTEIGAGANANADARSADGGAAMATPVDIEAEFQFVRDLFPNRDDEAGSRLAYFAVLRESADVHQTVGLLRYGARRYVAFVSERAASGFRIKLRTLAQFIESGLWRGNNAKDAIARAAAGHAGLDWHNPRGAMTTE
jgi:hypothetical protein